MAMALLAVPLPLLSSPPITAPPADTETVMSLLLLTPMLWAITPPELTPAASTRASTVTETALPVPVAPSAKSFDVSVSSRPLPLWAKMPAAPGPSV